ncbi:uncharacterized protein K02A2.6-like [Ischnura elegans]|uniref:uncharacterized protein K02A2.6-like n=1 Tax=Ischnura elegans TaxID=197161 RepID=UPI001ED8BD9A|nr:uncharacterized protein K02A2.6-like [Ischnura elegans]
MDSKQLKDLLSALTSVIKNQQTAPAPQIIPFEAYDAKTEKFSSYMERFNNYCDLKNVSDDIKKAQLLRSSIGKDHYNNLAAFLGPDDPIKEIDFETLKAHFEKMLSPSVSTVVSQHYFLSIIQQPHQSFSDFVASLKGKLKDCDFYATCPTTTCKKKFSIADIFRRAQFIRGLKDSWIREAILQETNLKDFDGILTKATALEASRFESGQLSKSPEKTSDQAADTNKIYRRQEGKRRSHRSSESQDNRRQSNSHPRHFSHSRNSRGHINYRSLGLDGICLKCGRTNHKSRDCRTMRESLKCISCGKIGQISKVCITTLLRKSKTNTLSSQRSQEQEEDRHSNNDYGITRIEDTEDLYEVGPDTDKYIVTVTLNNKPQSFEVDSGARFSLISEPDFNKLGLSIPLQPTSISFRSYSDHVIKPKGKVTVSVTYNRKSMDADLFIVPAGHDALLGRMWIRGLGISLKEIDNHESGLRTVNVKVVTSLEDIFKKYEQIFEERIGCVPNVEVHLQLREGVTPIFNRERDVPFALRERVERELSTLEKQGVITPIVSSDWGSPLVVIPKPDGGVRLCVDYKCGVNSRLVASNYPIRRIDEVLHSLRGSKYFCKLDLYKAYLHLRVDEEGSKIQTISTHKGTFRMNRLSFGIKTAPAEFNRILGQLLNGLPKVEAYFDDIICHGSDLEECTRNLTACLERLRENDLHLNRAKCSFFKESISYLGHVVSHNQIQKCPVKIQAVSQMPRPKDLGELRRFLGLVTYYSRFIPDFSSKSYPLRRLLRTGERFVWSAAEEAAFVNLKSELCSDRLLIPFDPSKQVILTTDASPTGIAAVLSHDIDGHERPIAYASRALTQAESNYSQLDREALAIIYATTHFFNYIFGKRFVLVTDNEPLSRIFHPDRPLPQMTSSRLLRYASFLSGLDYTVRCKKGRENENVDCLSRAPASTSSPSLEISIDQEINALHAETLLQISSASITADIVAEETAKDPELQALLQELKTSRKDSPYTVSGDMLFRSDRAVIPKSVQAEILKELHMSHLGVTKMKQLARRYVYWEVLDKDIERLVKSCESCAKVRHSPPKAPIHPWNQPDENWERVHIDFAGPFDSQFFLMCVDARSKWAEVRMIHDAPSSAKTIATLEGIFSVHGYPSVMVSDNASIFRSEEFLKYCKERGIFQKFSAPNHPATNGLAERSIQTLKRRLKAAADDPTPLTTKLRDIMFRYRATPLASGRTPAELYLKRRIRTRLDALLPNCKAFVPTKHTNSRIRSLQLGERVQVKIYAGIHHSWQFGIVLKKLGNCHYIVKLDNGRIIKRHINQLIATLVPKKQVTFSPLFPQHTMGVPSSAGAAGVPPDYQLPPTHQSPLAPSPPQVVRPTPSPSASSLLPHLPRNRQKPTYLKDYVVFK